MTKPMVSIYVPTFNHEKYITQALDSILMQQTQYSFEVLVGEDCSTDNTRQVLKEWEANHPDERFVYFYRQTNLHKTECPNALDLKLRCKGKYLICLEGDDFWTDPLKLEKQVSFLESHPEYYAVSHNCTVVGADSQPNGEAYPECKDPDYTFRHFANDILPGQYTTLLARNYMTDPAVDQMLLRQRLGPGDRNVYFSILFYGKICCMQEAMSAYRHITCGGSSFSATHIYRYEVQETTNRNLILYARRNNHKEALYYAEYLYFRTIRYALRTKRISFKRAWQDLKNVRHKLRCMLMLLKRDINLRVFHKSLSV